MPVNSGLAVTDVYCLVFKGTSLFAGTFGGVYVSGNYGASWSAGSFGIVYPVITSLGVGGTTLFAGTDGCGVYRTTNDGSSWTPVSAGFTNTDIWSFAASPGGSVFAGTPFGVVCSSDDGATWSSMTFGIVNWSVRALAVSTYLGSTTILAGTDGGTYMSTDNGVNWTPSWGASNVNALLSIPGDSLAQEPSVFAGTEDGRVIDPPGADLVKCSTSPGQVSSFDQQQFPHGGIGTRP